MSDRIPIPLTPIPIGLDTPEFAAIRSWSFADSYIGRMLQVDIPERVVLSDKCRIWVYRDPHGRFVGFGTLDVCEEYRDFTEGHPHPYIPLLAVNPTMEGRGYGKSIVRHLIGEAALLTGGSAGCHDVLFLDVYTSNDRAIGLYEKCGFAKVSDDPRPDPYEDNRPYIIMARRVSAARG